MVSADADLRPAARAEARFGSGFGRSLRQRGKVLPEHARAHNRSLVLQTLFDRGALSRADLARETGLTRVTMSDLVAELIAEGFIVERGPRESSGPGKPAILVDLDKDGHRIVGLDLSSSEVFVGAVLTLDGDIVVRSERPVPADAADVLPAVLDLARELVSQAGATVLGIGVGSPGVIDDRGVILTAPNLGWAGFDLAGALRAELDLPVLVANDANAAVLAEFTFGGAGGDVLLIKVGRGVGSGLLSSGQPTRGAHFAAGEIGHVTVGTDGGPRCACGKDGCLEAWIAVPPLSSRLAAADAAAHDGILRDAGERLAIAIAPIVGALDVSEVVLSGPQELLGGAFLAATSDTLRARTLAEFHDRVRVRMATQSAANIVLRGAAVMVLVGQLGVS